MANEFKAQPCVRFHVRAEQELRDALFALVQRLITEGHFYETLGTGPCVDEDGFIDNRTYQVFLIDEAGAAHVRALLDEHGVKEFG